MYREKGEVYYGTTTWIYLPGKWFRKESVVELGTPYMSKQQKVNTSFKKLKDNCCIKGLETLTGVYTFMSIIGQNSIPNLGTSSQKRIYSNAKVS